MKRYCLCGGELIDEGELWKAIIKHEGDNISTCTGIIYVKQANCSKCGLMYQGESVGFASPDALKTALTTLDKGNIPDDVESGLE
jgi:hypothetical protein